MQHESSVTHRKKLESGLTVSWFRFTGNTDEDWSVVCYSNGERWLFDNGSATQLELLGEVSDGLNKAEILCGDSGSIIALYEDGPQAFSDKGEWISSLPGSERREALDLL